MAWALKRPSGNWQGLYRDPSGKIKSAGTFSHKPKAMRAASVAEDESRKIGWRDPSASLETWGTWCTTWWPTRTVAAGTLARDLSPLKVHIRPRWDTVPLADITRHDVNAWVADLLRTESGRTAKTPTGVTKLTLSGASVRRIVALFSASLTAAVDAEILKANPAAGVRLPSAAPGGDRFLTRDEYAAVAAKLEPEDRAIADFLVGTGARWGEMAGLHAHRVDDGRGIVAFVETWDSKMEAVKPYPKGKERREVPLPDWVLIPSTMSRMALVFSQPGKMLDIDGWRKNVWNPAVARAAVGHVRIHDLRHTYASWLLQAGISLADVGKLLGHKSWTTTMRYAHLAETPQDHVLSALTRPGGLQSDSSGTARRTPLRLVPGG
ncbi:site-specific recombinase XerD [Frigoribacterium sp. PhB107]|uniref:tyrosine-type recombinase/integrase n=1 Tax=Frigoribacterium sp. PhB107 TaxID=2485172 RepID=UPI000F4A852B|nr:site-specific integrase [Frigoribacterium sp. PhB107]ROP78287.1 site-specific recombinase XerD [Frigoribacterium sp. PhB107]